MESLAFVEENRSNACTHREELQHKMHSVIHIRERLSRAQEHCFQSRFSLFQSSGCEYLLSERTSLFAGSSLSVPVASVIISSDPFWRSVLVCINYMTTTPRTKKVLKL